MILTTDVRRNFATHSDLSVEITDPKKKTFETMIADMIDARNTTPAVNQEFVRKGELLTSSCHRV